MCLSSCVSAVSRPRYGRLLGELTRVEAEARATEVFSCDLGKSWRFCEGVLFDSDLTMGACPLRI